jgi:predicted protein tyrosine phosphatase
MNNISISILSRFRASEYCKIKHKTDSVIISISTPNVDYSDCIIESNKENRVVDILPIEFMDADNPGNDDVYGNPTTIDDLMSDEDAKKIVAFVKKYKDKRILVHCDAGISRSSAVAAAILKHYTGDDSMIFDSRWYNPNRWVYRKVLEAFEIDNG